MNDLAFVLQIIALVCFFISWMGWTMPALPRRPWYWLAGGFFWLLLSFMLSHVDLSMHAVTR